MTMRTMSTGNGLIEINENASTIIQTERYEKMTMMSKETVPCPACGFKQEIEVYQTINADITPELVDRLFDGEINVFNCKSCGHRALVNQPLLFNDMRREHKIQYFPVDWLNENIDSVCEQYRGLVAELEKFRSDFGFMAKSFREMSIDVVFYLDEMIAQIKFKRHLASFDG
jgi:DNA-directed RNA polymerase subunit RPC12/RpoP